MPEEQNHDDVTLADIQKDIRDMRDDAKVQHLDSKLFAAYLFSGAVFLAGLGFHAVSSASCSQIFYGRGLMCLGVVSGIGFFIYHFCERRKRKALKGR